MKTVVRWVMNLVMGVALLMVMCLFAVPVMLMGLYDWANNLDLELSQ